MALIQFLTLVFVIFAGSRVILRFHDKGIGYGAFFFWSAVWTGVLLLVFNPGIADRTANIFGLQRGADAMFFFAVIILFYLIFRMYVRLDILDQTLTKLAINTSKEIHKVTKEKL